MTTTVHTEVDADGVAVITLDGPERLNAFSRRTAQELGEAYRACDADDDVRVVVLTGAGRAFCAGADLTEPRVFSDADDDFTASPVRPRAWEVRKLVIAAINGHAIGIGLTIALQCDLRLVAEDAQLAIPQVRRGMLGDAGSHHTLPRVGGFALAADLLLTGRTITGAEAAARGIATQALAGADVLPAALALARDVALNANPASVALSKQILWSGGSADEVEERETAAHRLLMAHPDALEGPAAWREGRAPRWGYRVSELSDLL